MESKLPPNPPSSLRRQLLPGQLPNGPLRSGLLGQRVRARLGVHAYGVLAALVGTVLVWALFFIPGEKPEPLVVYAWIGSTPESITRAQAEQDAERALLPAIMPPAGATPATATPVH